MEVSPPLQIWFNALPHRKKLKNGKSAIYLFFRGIVLIPLGVGEFFFYSIVSYKKALCGIDRVMRGVGTICYFLDVTYDEYKR